MLTSLWTASTGMKAQATNTDVISNNLANVNTVGFKKSRAHFQDLLYMNLESPGESTGADSVDPTGDQVGVGVKLGGITKEFSKGSMQRTDRDLDIAIDGDGFIPIINADGTDVYTRDGSLKLSSDGTIVNSDGYEVRGLGQIPANARKVNIASTGKVTYIDENGDENAVGDLQLALFTNPPGLESIGGNLYKSTPASGDAQLSQPGLEGAGSVQQYFLEMSNVSIVEEMVNLITAQRGYEMNSKTIQTSDEMLATANQIT